MTATRSWSWAAGHATPLFIRFVLDDPQTFGTLPEPG